MRQVWLCQATPGLQPFYLWCDVWTPSSVFKNLHILSSAYLLSHGVPNPYSTHGILCALPHNVFFFTPVTLGMVFSLPGSHYPSHFSTGRFYISSKKEDRHHSSRNLPWHSLFSSFQVRLDASILCSQKHSQLPQGWHPAPSASWVTSWEPIFWFRPMGIIGDSVGSTTGNLIKS